MLCNVICTFQNLVEKPSATATAWGSSTPRARKRWTCRLVQSFMWDRHSCLDLFFKPDVWFGPDQKKTNLRLRVFFTGDAHGSKRKSCIADQIATFLKGKLQLLHLQELEGLILVSSLIMRRCFPRNKLPLSQLRSAVSYPLPFSDFHIVDTVGEEGTSNAQCLSALKSWKLLWRLVGTQKPVGSPLPPWKSEREAG